MVNCARLGITAIYFFETGCIVYNLNELQAESFKLLILFLA